MKPPTSERPVPYDSTINIAKGNKCSINASYASSSTSVSTVSFWSDKTEKNHTHFNLYRLHQKFGSLKNILNISVQHLPIPSRKKKPRCQLYRWEKKDDLPKGKFQPKIKSMSPNNVMLCLPSWTMSYIFLNFLQKNRRIRIKTKKCKVKEIKVSLSVN